MKTKISKFINNIGGKNMKKIVIGLVFLIMVLSFVNVVLAEEVSFEVTENETNSSYTVNINVQVTGNDTQLRQDVYGNSNEKDKILNGAGSDEETQLREICSQPSLQAYFNGIGNIPPADFVEYLKDLGYGDETHVSFIWNMCQQEYINRQQGSWAQDLVGGGLQQGDLVSVFRDAISFLLLNGNSNIVYSKSRELAMILDSYFASDREVSALNTKIYQLDLRIQSLERTMETIASEEYCQGKLDIMKQYNLTGVKCGINSTIYWNAKKAGFDNYDTIAYNDCIEDWECVKWSDCKEGKQTRKCNDKNDCGTYFDKPIESMECSVVQEMVQAYEPQSINIPKKVESKTTTEQLLEDMIPVLLLACVSISMTLVIVGIKKDASVRNKRSEVKFQKALTAKVYVD